MKSANAAGKPAAFALWQRDARKRAQFLPLTGKHLLWRPARGIPCGQ